MWCGAVSMWRVDVGRGNSAGVIHHTKIFSAVFLLRSVPDGKSWAVDARFSELLPVTCVLVNRAAAGLDIIDGRTPPPLLCPFLLCGKMERSGGDRHMPVAVLVQWEGGSDRAHGFQPLTTPIARLPPDNGAGAGGGGGSSRGSGDAFGGGLGREVAPGSYLATLVGALQFLLPHAEDPRLWVVTLERHSVIPNLLQRCAGCARV